MDARELYNLIESFYGYKAKMQYLNDEPKEVACILYNSFFFKCGFYDRYETFGAGIYFGAQEPTITEFLGKRCSLNTDEKSIKESLQIVDDYCRLRLPGKFLRAYYKAYYDPYVKH